MPEVYPNTINSCKKCFIFRKTQDVLATKIRKKWSFFVKFSLLSVKTVHSKLNTLNLSSFTQLKVFLNLPWPKGEPIWKNSTKLLTIQILASTPNITLLLLSQAWISMNKFDILSSLQMNSKQISIYGKKLTLDKVCTNRDKIFLTEGSQSSFWVWQSINWVIFLSSDESL